LMADTESGDDLADIRAVIQVLRDHAEELRRKGVPVDDMIADLERKIKRPPTDGSPMVEPDPEDALADVPWVGAS